MPDDVLVEAVATGGPPPVGAVAAPEAPAAVAGEPPAVAGEPASQAPSPSPAPGPRNPRSLELLHGVEMSVTVELGRTKLLMREVLSLHPGSIIELDRAAGAPVDVLVNGKLLARGEVVVVDDELGVRLTEIATSTTAPEE